MQFFHKDSFLTDLNPNFYNLEYFPKKIFHRATPQKKRLKSRIY